MTLKQQVILIIFSIFFGIFFSLFTDFNNKIIRNKKRKNRFLFTMLFSLINALIYFGGLQIINNGILHIYSFIFLIASYFITHLVVNKGKKWYTYIRIRGIIWQRK